MRRNAVKMWALVVLACLGAVAVASAGAGTTRYLGDKKFTIKAEVGAAELGTVGGVRVHKAVMQEGGLPITILSGVFTSSMPGTSTGVVVLDFALFDADKATAGDRVLDVGSVRVVIPKPTRGRPYRFCALCPNWPAVQEGKMAPMFSTRVSLIPCHLFDPLKYPASPAITGSPERSEK